MSGIKLNFDDEPELSELEKQQQEAARLKEQEEAAKQKLIDDEKAQKEKEAKEKVLNDSDESDSIEIDGKEYIIDKEGNATLDGVIVYNKEQLKKLEDDSFTDDYITTIKDKTGIKLFNEEGEEVKYENSIEGFIQREIDVYNYGKQTAAEEVYTNLYAQHPEVKQLLLYKELHGSLKGFKLDKDYSNKKFIEGNEENNITLVKQELLQKGLTDEDITLHIESLKLNNKLGERAKQSEKFLNELDKTEELNLEKAVAEQQQKRIEAAENYYGVTFKNGQVIPLKKENSIYDKIVEKGKIGNFEIPITGITINKDGKVITLTRKQIFDYVAISKENGRSQAQLDDATYTQNTDNLLLRYLSHLLGKTVDKTITPNIQTRKKRIITSSGGQSKIKLNYN